jgi:rare lipoprotein A
MSRVMAAAMVVPTLALSLASATGCRRAHVAAPAPPPAIETHTGVATFYGPALHGRTTASGVPFDMHAMVAAHPTLPFGSLLRITNLRNGRTVEVRVVDRGPARGPRSTGVIVDLSRGAAERLDFVPLGRVRIRLDVLHLGDDGM